ncbi:MAG: hypothetical protein ACRDFS_00645 [Chloroflexota bacterium]
MSDPQTGRRRSKYDSRRDLACGSGKVKSPGYSGGGLGPAVDCRFGHIRPPEQIDALAVDEDHMTRTSSYRRRDPPRTSPAGSDGGAQVNTMKGDRDHGCVRWRQKLASGPPQAAMLEHGTRRKLYLLHIHHIE